MKPTTFNTLGARCLPESAKQATPSMQVMDVDFTRDSFTGQMTIDGYTVVICGSLKLTRMELWEADPQMSDEAEVIATLQAERRIINERERRQRPEVMP